MTICLIILFVFQRIDRISTGRKPALRNNDSDGDESHYSQRKDKNPYGHIGAECKMLQPALANGKSDRGCNDKAHGNNEQIFPAQLGQDFLSCGPIDLPERDLLPHEAGVEPDKAEYTNQGDDEREK